MMQIKNPVTKSILMKWFEAFNAVIPITAISIILSLSFKAMTTMNLATMLVGAVFLITGMVLYNFGTDIAIQPAGSYIGGKISSYGKIWLVILVCFIVGIIVTVAEPDLSVLAGQIATIPKFVLIVVVGLGVGIFMIIAVLRIAFKIPLHILLIISYGLVFAMAIIVHFVVGEQFIPLAFDSGGVTTGPMTVPFILMLCVGVSAVAGGDKSDESSFGMVGICSIGPILAVLILGLIYRSNVDTTPTVIPVVNTFKDVIMLYLTSLPTYLKDVAIALAPILVFFIIFDLVALKLPMKPFVRILIGFASSYIGLTLFLTGANIGYVQAGESIGSALAGASKWIIVPIGAVIGACIVLAEPAVHVLNKQVESITGGIIKSKVMLVVLSSAIAFAIALAMIRVITGISIWWFIVPGYAIALGLSFFVPKMFTAIAFDSGGVASGPMTATFLLPFAIGSSVAIGGNVITDAFGTVAMVAMTPLIALQILGLIYKIKSEKKYAVASAEFQAMLATEGNIIELM